MFTFPFEVPADLTALSAAEWAAFAEQARTSARAALAAEDTPAEGLIAYRDLMTSVQTEDTRRTELAADADAARLALSGGLLDDPAPVADPAPADPAPVADPAPTGGNPAPAPVNPPAPTLDPAPDPEPAPQYASMVASQAGTVLSSFSQAGAILDQRLARYGSAKTRTRRKALNDAGTHFRMGDQTLVRHGGISFQREFPEDLRITNPQDALSIIEHAGRQSRLPGGSLIRSMEQQVAGGRALTAAAGWCAPSQTIYDLCALETMDGLLDIPEVQAPRGGFFIPEDGGPDFSVIYNGIGNAGDVILTEYEVENGAEKVCVEIPCPDFVEVRLDVAYVCITGSLLQRRGYPEAVTRFSQGTMVAMAHKVNQSVIARLVAQSGSPITIPDNSGGDDAVSQLLSAIELAVEDIKYRNRMGRGETMEVVLPAWAIAPLRAALARRRGVSEWNVSDAEILAAFTTRHAVPRFVYDWQDAYSGLSNSPGRSTPITAFPTDISFLVYPAGTWVKPVQDVVSLDTVYDNAMLTQNQYTALFAEDGFNVMKMCRESRLYTVGFDPTGLCCA